MARWDTGETGSEGNVVLVGLSRRGSRLQDVLTAENVSHN
jgi:hypothetical protein